MALPSPGHQLTIPAGGVTQLFGASLSVIVTVKLQLAVLPEPSVAVQTTVTTPVENAAPDGGAQATVGVENVSVAVAVKVTIVEQDPGSALCVMLLGQVTTGGVASITVTMKVPVRVFPTPSVAVLVTIVVPSGNVDPDGGFETTVATEQSSLASTLKFTTAEATPGSLGTLMLAGHTIPGGVSSRTVTVNEQVARLPDASVAVVVTTVVPIGNAEPDG